MSGKEKGAGAESVAEESVPGADQVEITDFARGTMSDSNSDGFLDSVASPSRTLARAFDAMGKRQSLSI